MEVKQVLLSEVFDFVENDTLSSRLIARVFFADNLETYKKLVKGLSDRADIVLHLSDERFCMGKDTIPNMRAVIDFLQDNTEKNILIPNLAEYMRLAQASEKSNQFIYQILSKHVHSSARVWIPLFHAKDLFASIVGRLPEERYGDSMFEVSCMPDDFSATVYSKLFKEAHISNNIGIRAWLKLWDDFTIKSGMSFVTGKADQIIPAIGGYTFKVIKKPFDYIAGNIVDCKPEENLGKNEQWAQLAQYVKQGDTMKILLERALNMRSFNGEQVIASWKSIDEFMRWVSWLWYKLNVGDCTDYIAYAVKKAQTPQEIPAQIELAIFDCLNIPNFAEWNDQRHRVLTKCGEEELSEAFWEQYDEIQDDRKIKLLSSNTIGEQSRFIEYVSKALKDGDDIKAYMQYNDVCPELFVYLKPAELIQNHILRLYIDSYKKQKIRNKFDYGLIQIVDDLNKFDFASRTYTLQTIAKESDCYILWIDGMGLEWMDMLVEKVKKRAIFTGAPDITVGYCDLPSITSINISKTAKTLISEKINDLDELSHVKDKKTPDYFHIVAKQFKIIDKIAERIGEIARQYPEKDIVITSDHGMSRMAALGFHNVDSYPVPKGANACNLGRYCEFPYLLNDDNTPYVLNTAVAGNALIMETHNHFASQGSTNGEIHGGATPEELYVPIIHYKRLGVEKVDGKKEKYRLISNSVTRENSGNVTIKIAALPSVKKVEVSFRKMKYFAQKDDDGIWQVNISGLEADKEYQITVIVDDTYPTKYETITVKRKGLVIDDDF